MIDCVHVPTATSESRVWSRTGKAPATSAYAGRRYVDSEAVSRAPGVTSCSSTDEDEAAADAGTTAVWALIRACRALAQALYPLSGEVSETATAASDGLVDSATGSPVLPYRGR